jgi:hypothetical protein
MSNQNENDDSNPSNAEEELADNYYSILNVAKDVKLLLYHLFF